MKLHWRIKNRLIALKYRLLMLFFVVRRLWREGQCRRAGHVEFPEGMLMYCTRCHRWKEKGVWV